MKAEQVTQRRGRILALLTKHNTVKIADLLQMFPVSDETLRKDLMDMEAHGILIRRHGSVILASRDDEEALTTRSGSFREAKERIAEEALRHIPLEQTVVIGLDSGSTVWYAAKQLALREAQTIVTTSLDVLNLFTSSSNNNVYCLGGLLRQMDRAFYGPLTLQCINSVKMSVAILGTCGVKNWNGIGSVSFDDADAKRAFVRNSQCALALLDSSKFSKCALIESVRWEELDMVITDSGIGDEDRERVEKKTRLIIV